MPTKVTAKLLVNKLVANNTYELTFETAERLNFQEGQYIWVIFKDLKYPDLHGERRAFSISSPPSEKDLQIILRGSDSGYIKSLLELKPNDTVDIYGPFGSFLKEGLEGTDDLVFVSGGIAIAPFLSVIRSFSARDIRRNIYLLYANSDPTNAPYSAELKNIVATNKSIIFTPVFGRISASHLNDANAKLPAATWYITGPQGFVDSTWLLMKQVGVDPGKINFEQHHPMSDGFASLESKDLNLNSVNNFFKLAVDEAFTHMIITDINGYVLYANKAAENLTGYTFAEMQGNTPRLWGGLMTPEFYKNLWLTKKSKKESFTGKITNRKKNGDIYIAKAVISPIIDAIGKAIGFIGTEEDITKSEQAIADVQRLASIVRDTNEAIYSKDLNGVVLSWNRGAEEMFKYTKEEVLGKNIKELITPKDKILEVNDLLSRISKGERIVNFNTQRKRKDGTILDVNITISPILNENGVVTSASVSSRDISKEIAVDRMKTEFVSIASHQLRTPLTAIKWLIEILLGGDAGVLTPKQLEYVNNISESNERMIALVNSLLNISRMESGRLSIEPVPSKIGGIVEDKVKEVKDKSDAKKITIEFEVDPNLPVINIDPKLIGEVYLNLLTNAIAYTREGGKVKILVGMNSSQVVSQIIDSGIGIPVNQQSRVFERFFRADNAVKERPDGNGLGLYLVKEIVEASGGTIWFESTEGKGTKFYFSLPLKGSLAHEGQVSLS